MASCSVWGSSSSTCLEKSFSGLKAASAILTELTGDRRVSRASYGRMWLATTDEDFGDAVVVSMETMRVVCWCWS